MAGVHLLSIVVLGIHFFTVQEVTAYDVCGSPGGYSRYCYGDDEYCCNDGYSCCTLPFDANVAPAAFVGIILGCLFVFGSVIAVICICIHKQKQKLHPQTYGGTVMYISYPVQQDQGHVQYNFSHNGTQCGIAAPPNRLTPNGWTGVSIAPSTDPRY